MEMQFSNKKSRWLTLTVLILFLLQMMTLPFAAGFTYAGRSEAPEHVLTYRANSLTWDSATGINSQGVAVLDLFDAAYPNVASADGSKIVAPGTEGYTIVRLTSQVYGTVTYHAVLYQIQSDPAIPVKTSLVWDDAYKATKKPMLPKGVSESQVLAAVTGELKGRTFQDFDISWLWDYEDGPLQDAVDTLLGNQATAGTVRVGLYIVVEDNNDYTLPKTGDNSHIGFYSGMLVSSGSLLLILLWRRKKETQ